MSSIIFLTLSNCGYWIAGTDGVTSVRWAAPDQMPRASLVWTLSIASVELGHGSVEILAGQRPTEFKITCPHVRVRTTLELRYRLVTVDGRQELTTGTVVVQAFPADLTNGWSARLAGKNLVVVDAPTGLPTLFVAAGVPFSRVDDVSELQSQSPDVVLVGRDRLSASPLLNCALVALAKRGTGVLVLEQSTPDRLTQAILRPKPERPTWRADHPILDHLSADDLASLASDLPDNIIAIQSLPARQIEQIAGWPASSPRTDDSASGNSFFADQRTGRGRIVFCQLRLGGWKTDPRAQILMGNALDFLSAPDQAVADAGRYVFFAPVTEPRIPRVLTPAGDSR